MPAAKAVISPSEYPVRAYHMYLQPFEDDPSPLEGGADSLLFLWSKQRTNAKSIEGMA